MEIIQFLQQFDHPAIYYLMRIFSLLGDAPFYWIVLPILYWCWDQKKVIPFIVIVLSELILNMVLKDLFHTPRPQDVAMVFSMGFGFPSGHAQNSVVVFGYLAWEMGNRSYLWIAGVIIFFIGLSRLYLGVHFPADVIGGWFIGFCWLVICIGIKRELEKKKVQYPIVPTMGILWMLSLWLLLFFQNKLMVTMSGALFGLLSGILIVHNKYPFSVRSIPWVQMFKVGIGVVGVILLKKGMDRLFPPGWLMDYIQVTLIGLWIGFGAVWIFIQLHLVDHPNQINSVSPAR